MISGGKEMGDMEDALAGRSGTFFLKALSGAIVSTPLANGAPVEDAACARSLIASPRVHSVSLSPLAD